MAKTQIADIIKPEPLFRDSVVERSTELSAFWQSGIVRSDPTLDAFASGKGSIFDLPFWNDLSGASEILSDSGALTPAKLDQSKDRAVKHFRGRAWSANDLAKALAGDDPIDRVVEFVASWWARAMQVDVLLPSLQGIFATALAATHVIDIAIEDGDNALDANLIGSDAVIDVQNLLGDHWLAITAMAMHSKPFSRLQKLNLIEFMPLAAQNIDVPMFLGRRVVVDDGMPASLARRRAANTRPICLVKARLVTARVAHRRWRITRRSKPTGMRWPATIFSSLAATSSCTRAASSLAVHRSAHRRVRPSCKTAPTGPRPGRTKTSRSSSWSLTVNRPRPRRGI